MNSSQIIFHPLVPAIMCFASEKGATQDLFSRILNQDPPQLPPSDWRLTMPQLQQLGTKLIDATEDLNLGLHIGETLQWRNIGIVGYIVLNSRNVLEGLKKYHSYYQVVSNVTKLSILTNSQTIELCWKLIDNSIEDHHKLILEGTLASLKRLLTEQTGQTIKPTEIQFSWPAPADLSEYERVFDTHLVFNQPHIKAIFDRSVGELPCKNPNSEMLGVLENYVRECCFKKCENSPYSTEVLTVLKNRKGEILRIEQVAERLGVSVRNLQIKLKKEGITYRKIRDRTLCEQARLYLRGSPYSNEEISNLLGFSEPAVFYRNFKRWTGQTPKESRQASIHTQTRL